MTQSKSTRKNNNKSNNSTNKEVLSAPKIIEFIRERHPAGKFFLELIRNTIRAVKSIDNLIVTRRKSNLLPPSQLPHVASWAPTVHQQQRHDLLKSGQDRRRGTSACGAGSQPYQKTMQGPDAPTESERTAHELSISHRHRGAASNQLTSDSLRWKVANMLHCDKPLLTMGADDDLGAFALASTE